MTRLALAGNMDGFGASGSVSVVEAIISCSMPGSSIEALASDPMAARREGLGLSINVSSFDEHEFVAGKQSLKEILESLLLRSAVFHAVSSIRLDSPVQEAGG